jgi:glycine cleavage system H protein
MSSQDLKYSKEHEWVKVDGNVARVGITDYAQHALGDVVFVELPDLGKEIKAEEVMGVVESVKAVSDVYSPCTGKVIAVNEILLDNPETLNKDPYGEGWIVEFAYTDLSKELLSAQEYDEFIKEEGK